MSDEYRGTPTKPKLEQKLASQVQPILYPNMLNTSNEKSKPKDNLFCQRKSQQNSKGQTLMEDYFNETGYPKTRDPVVAYNTTGDKIKNTSHNNGANSGQTWGMNKDFFTKRNVSNSAKSELEAID